MPRESVSSIAVDKNVRCRRVYPVEGSDKVLADMKTVGIRLSREQAIHLARVLLVATQEWEELEITAYRTSPRQSDGTYEITVTSNQP
jgi:hypothetical protein